MRSLLKNFTPPCEEQENTVYFMEYIIHLLIT